jgi:hypothetical protein
MIRRNKQALYDALPGVFAPVETWANERTVDIVNTLHTGGVENAWIGLHSWNQALGKPELSWRVQELGWLIGPYDSYHSIHEPGREQWLTATFPDNGAYENWTQQDNRGQFRAGFQRVGRKLNPVYSFPLVQERVSGLLANGNLFNSWFVDCDAAGEIYNDYTPSRPTTIAQDIAARMERMAWLNNEHGMVVGSETGVDYAVNTIAFAHGLDIPPFAWMDRDMRDPASRYFLGRYWAPRGGAPEKFTLQVPVKDHYKALFMSPVYSVPLYNLVYNNAIITSYHWDWSTLKILDEIENLQLYQMLYNVPPMYHLDMFEMQKHSEAILRHAREWSAWSRTVIHEEMTDFQVLSEDRLVQMAAYGSKRIIVNYSDRDFTYQGIVIEAKSYQLFA